MSENMNVLKRLVNDGHFHHATYRNHGTLWEGLWFYRRDAAGFRGFSVAGVILKNDPDLADAENLVKGSGVSLGGYGNG